MPAVDISFLGDKELEKNLEKLVDKTQKKIARQAIRKGAKRTQKRIVANIERLGLVDSGVLLNAYKNAKIRSGSNKSSFIRIGPVNPTREELGISPDDKYYYPFAVEFGHKGAKAKPFIRPAVDEHYRDEVIEIGKDIGKGIEREAKK